MKVPQELYRQIGRNIARVRLERGMSSEDLAGAAGLTPEEMEYIEEGRFLAPEAWVLFRLAEELEVDDSVLREGVYFEGNPEGAWYVGGTRFPADRPGRPAGG